MKRCRIFGFLSLLPLLLTSCAKVPESLEFVLDDLGAEVEIHTENQLKYINDPKVSNIDIYSGAGVVDESKSVSVRFHWEVSTVNGDIPPKYAVQISEKADFLSALEYETKVNECYVSNLKIHTKYYWRVHGIYRNIQFTSPDSTFTTSGNSPRNMNIATLSNFRDLGGYSIGEGKFIKQGMIYRSAQLNDGDTKETLLSKDDIKTLRNDLQIKTDIDLRLETETGDIKNSPLGKDVNYYPCPMVFKGSNVLDNSSNQDSVKKFFNYLADENNYPMVFHCVQGKDRTGCLAYVIEALLGAGNVSNEPLLRDYLFTNFSDVNGVCKVNDLMASSMCGGVIEKEEGATLSEKTYNHLVNKNGISKETLNKIISILSE